MTNDGVSLLQMSRPLGRLQTQRKMYLNNVWRSIGTAELIFGKTVQIHKFVENFGFSPRGSP